MASILGSSSLLPLSGFRIASPKTPRILPNPRFKQPVAITSLRFTSSFRPLASNGKAAQEEEDAEETEEEFPAGTISDSEEKLPSTVIAILESYREALRSEDDGTVAAIEAFLRSIEDEKFYLESKVASLHEELRVERDRLLRMSADFENFRKRTGRERASLTEDVQGDVVDGFLPVLDNFERAEAQIRAETEGEERIRQSYQSIHRQFGEMLTSLGVVAIETLGRAFDPMVKRR